MLNKRIIGVIIIKNNICVQSINFNTYLPIGNPNIAISYLNKWKIDEIIILDIDGQRKSKADLFKNLPYITSDCFVPVAAGGGVKNLKDIENLIKNGADKVIINTCIFDNKKVIAEGVKEFGSQAIIASLDFKKIENKFIAHTKNGKHNTDYDVNKIIPIVEEMGVGEIFINSIDSDGNKNGYNFDLLNSIESISNIPIIVCGGAGNASHFLDVMRFNFSGYAAGNFFHFSEQSVVNLKNFIKINSPEINLRNEKIPTYKSEFDLNYRVKCREDLFLEELKYEYIEEEKI